MALKPVARKNPRPMRAGVPVLSPQKVRALRAFTNWLRALEANPRAQLPSFASEQGVQTRTVWKHVHGTPSVAETFVASVQGKAQAGLAMAIQRGIDALSNTDDEGRGIDNQDALKWADFFAKYAHGTYKQKGEAHGGVKVEVNVGVPAHVRARLGLDEQETKVIDAKVKELGDLVDD